MPTPPPLPEIALQPSIPRSAPKKAKSRKPDLTARAQFRSVGPEIDGADSASSLPVNARSALPTEPAAPLPVALPARLSDCGVCHGPINAFDETTACPACGLVFHQDCWRENRGCSAYGCAQVGALMPQEHDA